MWSKARAERPTAFALLCDYRALRNNKMRTVYDNGGECLGDEFVNLAGLQPSTKEAIQQMIYLDETL